MLEVPKLFRLHNKIRKENNLTRLKWDSSLAETCKKHSLVMSKKDTLFHDPKLPEIAEHLYGDRWVLLGENVGVGQNQDTLQKAFINSKEHRENILQDRYTHMGIGLEKSPYALWVTVRFVEKI